MPSSSSTSAGFIQSWSHGGCDKAGYHQHIGVYYINGSPKTDLCGAPHTRSQTAARRLFYLTCLMNVMMLHKKRNRNIVS